MSWQSYVESMEGYGCKQALITDHDGNKWAESTSHSLEIAPDEIKQVVKIINDSKTTGQKSGQTTRVGACKFMAINTEEDECVMKQIGEGKKFMLCCKKTNKGVCIGITEGEQEKGGKKAVGETADYLSKCGY